MFLHATPPPLPPHTCSAPSARPQQRCVPLAATTPTADGPEGARVPARRTGQLHALPVHGRRVRPARCLPHRAALAEVRGGARAVPGHSIVQLRWGRLFVTLRRKRCFRMAAVDGMLDRYGTGSMAGESTSDCALPTSQAGQRRGGEPADWARLPRGRVAECCEVSTPWLHPVHAHFLVTSALRLKP